jgi:hypothetical protein
VETIANFLHDRWFIVIAAIVALFVVVKVLKTVVKWVIVLAVIGALIFYGANYKDKLGMIGGELLDGAKSVAVSKLADEMKDAKYENHPDGTYTITSKNVKLEGQSGSDEVSITFKGKTVTVKINNLIRAYIEGAKNNTVS